jgi:CRP-like cAMP-binding protein
MLSAGQRDRLLAACTHVDLALGEVLCRRGGSLLHVYFPVDSFISLITQNEGEPGLEVGLIGNEGMLGAALVLGVDRSPVHALVQGPGAAWRMSTSAFRGQLADRAGLRGVVDKYLYVLMAQLATSAACVRFHEIGPRLARWLLMTHDRVDADSFHVTQEFLAHMLGVRRVGVTVAAGALQKRGVIAYARGELRIVDRQRLEAAACSCYAADSGVYSELLGRRSTARP